MSTIAEGQAAPEFTAPDQSGDSHTLSQYKGKPVILYFYPKDNTPGCTQQACDFRDSMARLGAADAIVLGISKDSQKSHQNFIDKYELPFPLLSDTEGAVCALYGAWVEKSMFGKKYMGIERRTILVDADGKIAKIWPKVKVKGHVDAVLNAVEAL